MAKESEHQPLGSGRAQLDQLREYQQELLPARLGDPRVSPESKALELGQAECETVPHTAAQVAEEPAGLLLKQHRV